MDKIPFAENMQECLPKDYTVQATEIQIRAMYEDARRWMECKERFKPLKNASDYCEKKKHAASIAQWILSLKPFKYREDMRRRMNHLRDKHKGA